MADPSFYYFRTTCISTISQPRISNLNECHDVYLEIGAPTINMCPCTKVRGYQSERFFSDLVLDHSKKFSSTHHRGMSGGGCAGYILRVLVSACARGKC